MRKVALVLGIPLLAATLCSNAVHAEAAPPSLQVAEERAPLAVANPAHRGV